MNEEMTDFVTFDGTVSRAIINVSKSGREWAQLPNGMAVLGGAFTEECIYESDDDVLDVDRLMADIKSAQ